MTQELHVRLLRDWGSIGPDMYGKHNQQVRDLVPKDQLLEYNVKQGWGPLCRFLEMDVPDKPFPKLNEGGSIKAIYLGQQIFGAATWLFYLACLASAMYVAARPQVASSYLRTIWRRTQVRLS